MTEGLRQTRQAHDSCVTSHHLALPVIEAGCVDRDQAIAVHRRIILALGALRRAICCRPSYVLHFSSLHIVNHSPPLHYHFTYTMAALQPPQKVSEDPGAHELEGIHPTILQSLPDKTRLADTTQESSDDHFSSASEGDAIRPESASSNPIMRVERVDDQPAHGEVPGTEAYNQRRLDFVPDEVEVVPDGQRSRSNTTRSRAASNLSTNSGSNSPIPRTVVERVDSRPAHGEVDGTPAKELRMADAEPDEIKLVPQSEGREESDPESRPVSDEDQQTWFRNMWEGKEEETTVPTEPEIQTEVAAEQDAMNNDDDDFGDDFDDFAEGEEADDDFGDFDEADVTPMAPEPQPVVQPQQPDILAGLPPLNLTTTADLDSSIQPYLDAIFPDSKSPSDAKPPSDVTGSAFLTDRSLSLWQQLLQPPPMAPPNWTRSRIRRLFLVSLGVPVDLDEILPPSKQKRLVLPNINLSSTASPRHSTAIDRLKQGSANNSTTSLDSKGAAKQKQKRPTTLKGPPPPPDFDLNAAALLCSTTVEALANMFDAELREHVKNLDELNGRASGVLEYWLMRRDEGVKEKEALEGVIENLVGFVKGRRGG
ncbi:hypothetical protein Q7P37_003940 [Cladosporium fusiforme]